MKLYTEEQVRNMLDTFILFTGNEDANDYIEYMTPIELPSDEEVENWAHNKYHEIEDSRWFEPLQVGATWMRSKLTSTKEK